MDGAAHVISETIKAVAEPIEDWPKPVAELEDTGEPYRKSEQYKPEKPYESFQKALCNHGLYKPLCARCKAA